MRLIDADEVLKKLEYVYPEYAVEVIKEAPTEEAISIEWIEKEIERLHKNGTNNPANLKGYALEMLAVAYEEMLKRWRKGNE